ncbi:MAG TPA: energy-coupling factor transporter transmembrane protein EcfT, partial [Slackia equolifaciens]|nr:energy-coupling factor transporter transmembrane protein EcfT [Slackia equolifaciens]
SHDWRVCHTVRMRISVSTYIPGASPVHACDARAKIVVLAVYTVALFFVDTWAGMALMLAALGAVVAASRIGMRPFSNALGVTAVLMVLAIVFNGFSIDVNTSNAVSPALGVTLPLGETAGFALGEDAGVLGDLPQEALFGSFGVTCAGLARGCFFALRILALVMGSLVVAYTTTSTDLMNAFSDFLSPARRLRVPVDDIATVLSIAVRFIPVTFEEFGRIRDAQWSRCASFDEGSIATRVRAWGCVFVPMFVGLFRRADALAIAMDARCYGMPGVRRTSLSDRRFRTRAAVVTLVGVAACVAVAVAL